MIGGIYIHVPFCRSKCTYCAFYSEVWDNQLGQMYLEHLRREMAYARTQYPLQAQSLYLGGGTPALLPGEALTEIVAHVRTTFNLAEDAEITIEANPDSVTVERAKLWRSLGINRVSIGVQTADDELLKVLNRPHNFAQAQEAVQVLKQVGFINISIDLMCGLPGQTLTDWRATLDQVSTWETQHISIYPLQLEEGTPLAEMVEQGIYQVPSDDETVAMLDYVAHYLADLGYQRYEIANYAREGYVGRHNLNYWHLGQYLGFGPAAASYYEQTRWTNASDLKQWALEVGYPSAHIDEDSRSLKVQMAEYAFLALRLLQEGLSQKKFLARFGCELSAIYGAVLQELVDYGWLVQKNDHYYLADQMISYANEVFLRLLPADD